MLRILHVMSTHGRNAVPCKRQTNKTAPRIYKETAGCYQYREEYFTIKQQITKECCPLLGHYWRDAQSAHINISWASQPF